MIVLTLIVGLLLVGGLFAFFTAAVGMIRFPDFYSRLHPAGMIDCMGVLLSMGGLALFALFIPIFGIGNRPAMVALFLAPYRYLIGRMSVWTPRAAEETAPAEA